jgi:uncharacterized protein YozE (UPF0346 family)
MKYLITESQGSRLKKQLTQSFDEIGFFETIDRYKLSIPQLDIIYKNSRLPEFSCDDLHEICNILILDGNVRKKYITEEYHIFLDIDDFLSSVYFKVTDKKTTNSLDGYATPYWDGRCFLPIDIELYNFTDDDGNSDDEELSGQFYEQHKLPTEFESFQAIIDWLENGYIKYIVDFCRRAFEELEY